MPTYTFENTKTGEVYDDMMSISEKEAFLEKNPHIQQRITSVNIVSGIVGMGRMKNDDGWREVQSKIAEAHPNSEFGQTYGKKSIKRVKTENVVAKHRKRQQGKK